jgi:hypothetical protein
MTTSIYILKRLMNNLKTTIPVCDPEAISQLVDTATQIERTFFRHEISEKDREKLYRKLYESVAIFRSRCPCR